MSRMNLFGRASGGTTLAAGSFGGIRPRYMYRVSFGGMVRVTTDPIEVARIRRVYPNARVEILPFQG